MPTVDAFNEDRQRRTGDRVHWFVENARGTKALDLGSGRGITSILLGRRGFTCLGITMTPGQLDFARRELAREAGSTRARVSFELLSPRAVGGGPYDTVIIGEALEVDPDPAGLMNHLISLLAPDGCILIGAPYAYQHPSGGRSLYLSDVLSFMPSELHVHELQLVGKNLLVVASREQISDALATGRELVEAIERILSDVLHEAGDVKGRLEAKVDFLSSRLDSKVDEVESLKDKLRARAEEAAHLRGKLKERADDVAYLSNKLIETKAKLEAMRPPATRLVWRIGARLKRATSGPKP